MVFVNDTAGTSADGLIDYLPANGKFTVRQIFEDNHNWDVFLLNNQGKLRQVEIDEVNEMLRCKDSSRGFYVYHCPKCDEYHTIRFGCNSRICSSCGKNYTDKWAKNFSKKMFDVPHRHLVLTISDKLRPYLLENRNLWKVLMDSAIQALNDTFSWSSRREVLTGTVVVLHPFGKDLNFKPHIHVLVMEGGFDEKGHFVHREFIPAKMLRKTWQYQVLTQLKRALPENETMSKLIHELFHTYSEGFYVYLPEKTRIRSKREIANYVGRYVRHPAIANSRICGYDGKNVIFWYIDSGEKKHHITMDVQSFIRAIIQHIPDPQFKMIRYYGAYCRKWKSRYAMFLSYGSIRKAKIEGSSEKRTYWCPKCNSKMEFVTYWKEPPPPTCSFGTKIADWNYISSNSSNG
jgi:ribosomal protein L37AE/L43A